MVPFSVTSIGNFDHSLAYHKSNDLLNNEQKSLCWLIDISQSKCTRGWDPCSEDGVDIQCRCLVPMHNLTYLFAI